LAGSAAGAGVGPGVGVVVGAGVGVGVVVEAGIGGAVKTPLLRPSTLRSARCRNRASPGLPRCPRPVPAQAGVAWALRQTASVCSPSAAVVHPHAGLSACIDSPAPDDLPRAPRRAGRRPTGRPGATVSPAIGPGTCRE